MDPALSELLDRQAMFDVMIRYGTSVDARDLDRYRTCFVDDVTVVGFLPETIEGLDAYMEFVEGALKRFGATQHMMGNPTAEIRGDSGTLRTEVQATHFLADDPKSVMTLWAYYIDEMERRDDGWVITRHELVTRGTQVTKG